MTKEQIEMELEAIRKMTAMYMDTLTIEESEKYQKLSITRISELIEMLQRADA